MEKKEEKVVSIRKIIIDALPRLSVDVASIVVEYFPYVELIIPFCELNQLFTMKQLCEGMPTKFSLSAADIRILEVACRNGSQQTVEWIFKTFDSDRRMVHATKFHLLLCACESGNKLICKWITTVCVFPAMTRHLGHRLLLSACFGGNVKIVRWLYRQYGLTIDDTVQALVLGRPRNGGRLDPMIERGHLSMIKFLLSSYRWDIPDLIEGAECACRHGHSKIVLQLLGVRDWLLQTHLINLIAISREHSKEFPLAAVIDQNLVCGETMINTLVDLVSEWDPKTPFDNFLFSNEIRILARELAKYLDKDMFKVYFGPAHHLYAALVSCFEKIRPHLGDV